MSRPPDTKRVLWRKIALLIGFLAVTGATLFAHTNPATGYELSVYTMTPVWVWVGLAVALATALFISFSPTVERQFRSSALLLGGLATFVFVGIPIIRGYSFYGHHDALTHLGWTRALSDGTIVPTDVLYPGIHTVSVFINSTVGISIPHAMLLVVALAMLLSFVFIPLTVGEITSNQFAVTVAAFSAFLLLSVTTIATHMHAHAMTQSVMLSSLFVYLATVYLLSDHRQGSITAIGAGVTFVSIALVVYHPQLVAHLLVFALGVSLVQFVARRYRADGPIAAHQPLYGQTLVLFGAFLVWSSNYNFFLGTIRRVGTSAGEFLLGTGDAGESVATQGASLGAIGGSVTEIFFKLFGANLLFVLLLVGLVLIALFKSDRLSENVATTTIYFSTGLAALGGLFAVYFAASSAEIYFRVFGLMMLFVTILGSIAIANTVSSLSRLTGSRTVYSVSALLIGILLVASLLAVFPSPYIYTSSGHVTDAQLNGYERSFAAQDDDVDLVGVRDGPNRFDDAINANEERMKLHGSAEEDAFDEGLPQFYSSDHYLAITEHDQQRETIAYQELRFTEADFDSIGDDPGISRVQSNGEFELYYVHGDTE